MIQKGRLFAAAIVGHLFGYAQLTNSRVRSKDDMGDDYIIEFTPPTLEEIRNACPLATVLPQGALTHVVLFAATLSAGTEDGRAMSQSPSWWTRASDSQERGFPTSRRPLMIAGIDY